MTDAATATADGRSRKRPGVEEQRQVIARAAVDLFAEQGVRAVSIGRICEHANVSRPTFYRCFDDKDALVESLYEEAVSAHIGAVLLRGSLRDPEQLRERLADMMEAIFSRAPLARLVFVEANDPNSPAAQIVDRGFEEAARVLSRDLKRITGRSPGKVYLKSVMAAVQWIVHDAIRKGLSAKVKREAVESAHTLVIRALA